MRVDALKALGVSRLLRGALGTVAIGFAVLACPNAHAFCRTTTCDADDSPCERDPESGCVTDGKELFWPGPCVSFGVHTDGSVDRGIGFDPLERAAIQSFQTWITADCGSGDQPSISVVPRGELFCDRLEFNNDPPAPNANLIVFRDREWPHCDVPGSPSCTTDPTIALTTVTFIEETGEILDVDMELNSANVAFTMSDEDVQTDLRSVLTHEIGHFFGLSHTREPLASMNERYDSGDISFRSLHRDDAEGICAIYRPGEAEQDDCAGEMPRNGFSRYCGAEGEDPTAEPPQADAACLCDTPGGTRNASSNFAWLGLLGLATAVGVRHRGQASA